MVQTAFSSLEWKIYELTGKGHKPSRAKPKILQLELHLEPARLGLITSKYSQAYIPSSSLRLKNCNFIDNCKGQKSIQNAFGIVVRALKGIYTFLRQSSTSRLWYESQHARKYKLLFLQKVHRTNCFIKEKGDKQTSKQQQTVLSNIQRKKVIKRVNCITNYNMSSLLEHIYVGSLTPRRQSRVETGSLKSSSLGSNLFVGQKRIETEKTDTNFLQVPKTLIPKKLTKKIPKKLTKKISKKFSM